LLDTADTDTWDGGDLDVSLVTPGGTPGVSNEVVVLAGLGSVTNGGDGVVELGSARSGVEDTSGVHLEHGSVGLEGHGHWGGGDGGLEGIDGGWGHGLVGLHVNLSGVLGGLARSISGGVGVVVLEVLSLLLGVLEGVLLPSTVASVGGVVAINELLLGEGEEVSGGEEMSTLNGSGGGEGPA